VAISQIVVHLLLLLLLPPLLLGIVSRTKAILAGRRGAPLLQPYHDLFKLLRKEMVLSRTTTWIFLAGPAVTLVATVFAGLLLPLGSADAPLHFAGDIVLFAYLLALGRFLTATAALDTGSSFEGMGAARELTFSCLAEPTLFLGMLALARVTGSLELSGMLGQGLAVGWTTAAPALVLVVTGLFIVALTENCRIPFDDPNTHLELTMIHEVMVLDHSGPALGAILYGAAIKFLLFGSVVVHVVLPRSSGGTPLDAALLVAALLAFAVAVGLVESTLARLRLTWVPNLLIGAALMTGFGLILVLVS
jgi:formate hydrogenlyase subunit 4